MVDLDFAFWYKSNVDNIIITSILRGYMDRIKVKGNKR